MIILTQFRMGTGRLMTGFVTVSILCSVMYMFAVFVCTIKFRFWVTFEHNSSGVFCFVACFICVYNQI